MSTCSSARNVFLPLDNPELTIRRRSHSDPTLLNNSEMAAEGNGDLPVPDLLTMEELCQSYLNGRGGPIALNAIQATNYGLKNDMIQQSIKVNGVTDDALRLYIFLHSLTHHATALFDRLPRNSINAFEQMAKMFIGKYFPPSMVTKLRNEITNFYQRPDESLFEAWEHYKLSSDRFPNHNMLPVTQIDNFCNGLTLRYRDTINAAARATIGNTQNVYAARAYHGNSYQPQGNLNLLSYRSDNYLGPPELVDHSISCPVGVAEDVFVKVGTFYFPANFVVIDFDADPRVPLILRRSFLKTRRALIDVFKGEPTLHVEVDAFLALEDDPTSLEFDQSYVDTEGDILLLEAFLNDDPSLNPPNKGNFLRQVRKELKIYEAKSDKSSIDEPSEVELKDLPPHLEYTFLEGNDKLPVIIAKDLSVEEKIALITVLKSCKRAIAWKLFDIKGIDPEFCTHKIIMEEDFKPAVQHQRRVNPKIHDVIKNEVLKLLDAGLIYPIFNKWRLCIDYRKLNEATRKDYFPLHFMDQMLERLAGNQHCYFLDGFSSDFAIGAVLGQRQEKHFRPIHYANHSALKYLFAKKDLKARLLR
nr:reverse transcriptase domain-containing protein [Tanacetum cinerariifolium]